MIRFVTRRLLWTIPTLFVITFLVFVAIRHRDGSGTELPAVQPTGQRGEDPAVQGHERPTGNIVSQYFHWLWNFVTFNWGRLDQGQPSCLARAARSRW